jgi:arylsulfatase A-like enzyme
MDRRGFIRTAAAGLTGAAALRTRPAAAEERTLDAVPNIVFIFSDQQRHDTVECYGRPLFPGLTPNLDAMAAEGVRFEHAFTCQPVCGPARSCLQTGRYATEVGCFRNDVALPLDAPTVARQLRAAGYETGYIGKWHLASSGEEHNYRTSPVPSERRGGFEDYWLASDVLEFTSHGYDGHMFDGDMRQVDFEEGRYRADCLTDFAVDYLRTRDGARPFYLFLSYIEPHHQNDHKHFEGRHGAKARYADFTVPGDLAGTQGNWREEMADYLGCCAAIDDGVGRIRATLDELGLADDTLVIYTSDHGCHFCTRNGEYKRSCHDDSIRVPMLACGPGFPGGGVVRELVSLIDLPPTVLAAAGAPVPGFMRGSPLQPLAAGDAGGRPEEVFVQISESQVGRAIRTARWKYSVMAPDEKGWQVPDAEAYVEDFLYDLEADPWERSNLVADPALADVRAELASRLKRRMVAAGEAEPAISPRPDA